jgi:hypothetical protein
MPDSVPVLPLSIETSLNRRHLLRLAGLAAAGLATATGPQAWAAIRGSTKSSSGTLRSPASRNDEIPAEWLQREGTAARAYAAYLASLRLRTMTVTQVIAAHAKKRGSVWNTLPPRSAWPSIVPTLRAIDWVGLQLRMPVAEIVSVYRSPAYNSRCEGARSGSWHCRNVAVDFKFAASPSVVAATARSLRQRGYFRGGIGRYGTFVHLDTRGENIDW